MRKAAPQRTYSPEERGRALEMLRRGRTDRKWAIRAFTKIADKQQREIRFNLWPFQEEIIDLLSDPTVRTLIIRKYRQGGISQCLLAWHLLESRYTRNKETLILNKDDNDTAVMFNRVHFMDERLPEELQGAKKSSQSKVLHYADTNSILRIDTAGASESVSAKKGRSATVHCLHVTEPDYIEHLDKINQGAVNSVAPGGKIIYESTSNGPRGAMDAMIMGVRKRGQEIRKGELWRDGDTVVLFISALPHPEYRRPVPLGFELALDEDERKEEERILRVGQERGMPLDEVEGFICFRRWKVNQFVQADREGGGANLSPARQFKLEFPVAFEDTREAAGRNYFNPGIIAAERAYVEALDPYRLVRSITRQPGGRPILGAPTEDNRVTILAAPELGYKNRYVVFGDAGQGNATSDPDCIKVLDRLKMEVVATVHGRLGAYKATQMMLALAEFYDNAWINWDMTGIGAEWRPLVLASLYPRIWTRREVESPLLEPDAVGLVWGHENKLGACSMLRAKLEHKEFRDYDLAFFDECLQFGFDEKGKGPQASNGFTDDRVMANAGLLWTSASLPAVALAEVRPKPFQEQSKLEQRVREIKMAAAQPEYKGNGNWD